MRGKLGWLSILRLGLVQSALGAIVVLTSSTLNRVMIVEFALPASLPAALVGWHYAVQLTRPAFGHISDHGRRRTPWIIGGMGMLALGAVLAANAVLMMASAPITGAIVAVFAFTMIGGGVGACGTSLLALLASEVDAARRPAAASITWIMMIVGIVFTAATAGLALDPFSPQRLALVASAVCGTAFLVTLLAVWGVERSESEMSPEPAGRAVATPLRETLREIWQERLARNFTIFVFVSMLAYSAQDLILEPYAGLVFNYSLGESTKLTGVQHAGVLLGMIMAGLLGTLIHGDRTRAMRNSTILGCLASAVALVALGTAGLSSQTLALKPAVFMLGFSNGVFAVSAIGLMMSYAGQGANGREGARVGVWGAAQAIAFGTGGAAGAVSLDLVRHTIASTEVAFASVFFVEGALFVVAAGLALKLSSSRSSAVAGNRKSPKIAIAAGE